MRPRRVGIVLALIALGLGSWAWRRSGSPAVAGVETALTPTADPEQAPRRLDGFSTSAPEQRVAQSAETAADQSLEASAGAIQSPASVVESEPRPPHALLTVPAEVAEAKFALHQLRVRALSARRIADRWAEGEAQSITLRLSPGGYELWVGARGCEPTEVHDLTLAADQKLTLAPVQLRLGSSRIVGIVRGLAGVEQPVKVELFGEGRRPCAQCFAEAGEESVKAWQREQACANCGYAKGRSLAKVVPSGEFEFEALASGSYALRLVDSADHVLTASITVEVRANATVSVVLDAPGLREVRVEFFDTNGASLSREWASRLAGRPTTTAPINWEELVIVFREGVRIDLRLSARDGPQCDTSFSPPRPLDEDSSLGFSHSAFARDFSLPKPYLDDWDRSLEDRLAPASVVTIPPPGRLQASVEADGLVLLRPVTTHEQRLSATVGPLVGTVVVPADIAKPQVSLRFEVDPQHPEADSAEGGRVVTFAAYERSN